MKKEIKLKIISWLWNGVTYKEVIERLEKEDIIITEEDIKKVVKGYIRRHLKP